MALRGFRVDDASWRSNPILEEKALAQNELRNVYSKQSRKSDEFKQDLPEEKVKSFIVALGKLFVEPDDYEKEASRRTPDYDGFMRQAGLTKKATSFRSWVEEPGRNVDRCYHFATAMFREAEFKDELFLQGSPLKAFSAPQNAGEESNGKTLELKEFLEQASQDGSFPHEAKPCTEQWVRQRIPLVGENVEAKLPQALAQQLQIVFTVIDEERFLEDAAHAIQRLTDEYAGARDEDDTVMSAMQAFLRWQQEMQGVTKADVLEEDWAELLKSAERALPPLEEDMLAEYLELSANVAASFMHSWGTADKLYDSEAVDACGQRCLLGAFEMKEQLREACADWAAERKKARVSRERPRYTGVASGSGRDWTEAPPARSAAR